MRFRPLLAAASFAASLAAVFVVVIGAACSPTNPFDPATPQELQAKGSVKGSVVLDDATAPADALAGEIAAVQVTVLDESGRPVQKDGADRTVPLAHVDATGGT